MDTTDTTTPPPGEQDALSPLETAVQELVKAAWALIHDARQAGDVVEAPAALMAALHRAALDLNRLVEASGQADRPRVGEFDSRRLRAAWVDSLRQRDQLLAEIDRLGEWLKARVPHEIGEGGAVDNALRLLDRLTQPPTPAGIAAPEPEPDYGPAGEPGPHLINAMRRIAETYRGVEYDAEDRPEEVAAIRVAARMAGLIPVPSTTITPRSFRGCVPPMPPLEVAQHLAQTGPPATPRTPRPIAGTLLRTSDTGRVWTVRADGKCAGRIPDGTGEVLVSSWEDLAAGTRGDVEMLIPLPYGNGVDPNTEAELGRLAESVVQPAASMAVQLFQAATAGLGSVIAEAHRRGRGELVGPAEGGHHTTPEACPGV